MAVSVTPSREEIAELVPAPGSILWDYGADPRLLATAGYALLLQVSHPTVAAGVREHSDYASDPWGRLLRTLDYVYVMTYAGPEAAASTGRRLREMHKRIRGTAPDGRRYHALEPEPYAWVHATLVDGIVTGHRRFGRPLSPMQVDRLYGEWLALGRVIGVRDQDLPGDWRGFREYFDHMVAERLEDNDVIHGVLETLMQPARPPVPLLGEGVWRVARLPMARLFRLATVGLLPPVLRQRCGLEWSRGKERELRALAAASRAATPLLPKRLRNLGPTYLRWRRDALARGESVAISRSLAPAA
jgi:uncharacterized protein (DUF2236 family)